MFEQRDGTNGFRITFQNGYVLSAFWGEGSYTGNRHLENGLNSATVEVAVWSRYGAFVKLSEHDDVRGFVTPDEFARVVDACKAGTIEVLARMLRDQDYMRERASERRALEQEQEVRANVPSTLPDPKDVFVFNEYDVATRFRDEDEGGE